MKIIIEKAKIKFVEKRTSKKGTTYFTFMLKSGEDHFAGVYFGKKDISNIRYMEDIKADVRNNVFKDAQGVSQYRVNFIVNEFVGEATQEQTQNIDEAFDVE